MEKLKFKNGFTLIETLIYVVIFTIFVISMVTFSSSMTSSRLHNQMVLEINDQGSKIMKIITQTIRNASQINSPTIGNSALNLNIVTELPITNPTIFSESNGVLYVTEGVGNPIALTNNKVIVSNLNFSNFSRPDTPNIIKVSFKLTSTALDSSPGGTYSFTFNGSGTLRK